MVPASAISIQPVSSSQARGAGTTSGRRSASRATSPASKASTSVLALNHTSPASVGTRIAVDQTRTCGCSISPVRVSPSSPSRSAIHPCAVATQAGSSHRSMSGRYAVRVRVDVHPGPATPLEPAHLALDARPAAGEVVRLELHDPVVVLGLPRPRCAAPPGGSRCGRSARSRRRVGCAGARCGTGRRRPPPRTPRSASASAARPSPPAAPRWSRPQHAAYGVPLPQGHSDGLRSLHMRTVPSAWPLVRSGDVIRIVPYGARFV